MNLKLQVKTDILDKKKSFRRRKKRRSSSKEKRDSKSSSESDDSSYEVRTRTPSQRPLRERYNYKSEQNEEEEITTFSDNRRHSKDAIMAIIHGDNSPFTDEKERESKSEVKVEDVKIVTANKVPEEESKTKDVESKLVSNLSPDDFPPTMESLLNLDKEITETEIDENKLVIESFVKNLKTEKSFTSNNEIPLAVENQIEMIENDKISSNNLLPEDFKPVSLNESKFPTDKNADIETAIKIDNSKGQSKTMDIDHSIETVFEKKIISKPVPMKRSFIISNQKDAEPTMNSTTDQNDKKSLKASETSEISDFNKEHQIAVKLDSSEYIVLVDEVASNLQPSIIKDSENETALQKLEDFKETSTMIDEKRNVGENDTVDTKNSVDANETKLNTKKEVSAKTSNGREPDKSFTNESFANQIQSTLETNNNSLLEDDLVESLKEKNVDELHIVEVEKSVPVEEILNEEKMERPQLSGDFSDIPGT